MSDQAASPPPALDQVVAGADESLARLDAALAQLTDGDLHRAHHDGGWTVSQTISHMNVCAVIWLGDLKRLESDPELRFFFREEIGHDLLGYPPPTIDIARRQIASTRRTIATAVPALSAEILAREVEIPDLGTMTVQEWMPLVIGHASTHHVAQAFDIMTNRGFAPEGV